MKASARWLALGVIALALIGLTRLRFETDVLELLPDDVPSVAGLKLYQQAFAKRGEVIATVSAKTAEEAEAAVRELAAKLEARTNLVARAVWQAPWMDDAEATAELLAWLWLSQPTDAVSILISLLQKENASAVLEETKGQLATSLSPMELARLGHDPFGLTRLPGSLTALQNQDWFASPNGTLRLVFIQPATAPANFLEWETWLADLRKLIGNDLRVGLTGPPVFMVETATGMRSDMKQSVAFTVIMIAALFWWAHRQFRPLAWMLSMLGAALAATLGLGGLLFGTLNVVSAGFAAILLGLGVDYALVLYQELLDSGEGVTADEVRSHAEGGIWWSAGTTALAFALLNFAGLPGFGQLGTLVAIGIILAAASMLHGFLPMAARRVKRISRPPVMRAFWSHRLGWRATALAGAVCAGILIFAGPGIDRGSDLFSSKGSEAARVAREMEAKMNQGGQTFWALARGANTLEVRRRLEKLDAELRAKNANADLPLALWPDVERQRTNSRALKTLAGRVYDLEAAVEKAGFTSDAMALTRAMIGRWAQMNVGRDAIWPASESIKWLIDRVAARTENEWVALGMIRGASAPRVQTEGVIVTSWTRLAGDLLEKVETRMVALTMGIVAVLILCLRLALRSWVEVALSFATLGFGFALMTTAMALLGWKWNLLNLTVIPLLLGASVDYTIHVQRALRRHKGDAAEMRRTIGRALFLLTAAAVAGFGSLGFASNAGWASFELLCALGMICVFVTALYLLPAWHYSLVKYSDD